VAEVFLHKYLLKTVRNGKMGFAYHNMNIEEIEDDIQTVQALRGKNKQ